MTAITPNKKMGDQFVGRAVTPVESEEVQRVLEIPLADLRLGIAHTDRHEFREILNERRAVLQERSAGWSATSARATTPGRDREA